MPYLGSDSAFAELYGVETKRINEAVRNNPKKFPSDYILELKKEEVQGVRIELRETRDGLSAKACLCADARRQVDGHEDRIRFLERKVA